MLVALMIPLVIAALVCVAMLVRAVLAQRAVPSLEAIMVGAVANFFDTLGIGSFAPTMAWFKFRRLMPDDRLMPSTMLVGYTPPSIAQAMIFLVLLGVFVDPVLLVGCVLALVTGALLGVPIATRVRAWVVQAIVAGALLLAAAMFAVTNLHLMPGGGTATTLPPEWMAVAIAANFGFGVLVNFGVGNYAPTLILLSLMGMDPHVCFPIMAGGAAIAGSAATIGHIRLSRIDLRLAAGLAIGGIPAVLVAAFIVRDLPVETLRWLVIVVVLYAAFVMLREAAKGRRTPVMSPAEAALEG